MEIKPKARLVVMQPTSLCNLNCTYCYVPERRDATRMDDLTLENAIKNTLQSTLFDPAVGVDYLWHAGEPLLVGMDFYKRALELIKKHNVYNYPVRNLIQTNGVLINDEWAKFFADNEIGIGLSVDGPEFLNDQVRVGWNGRGAFKKIMKGLDVLKKHNIEVGALCVLRKESFKYPNEVFDFFHQAGFKWVGFNIEEIENDNKDSSLKNAISNEIDEETIELYSHFMSTLFDRWQKHKDEIEIRELKEILDSIVIKVNKVPEIRNVEVIAEEVRELAIITIMKNGDISTYSPEFAGAKNTEFNDFVVGNINEHGVEAILENENFKKIRAQVNKRTAACHETCDYFDTCGGSYLCNLFFETGSFEGTDSIACKLHRQQLADVVIEKLSVETV